MTTELSPALIRRAAANLIKKVNAARQHPRDFFEIAAREEHSRERLTCAPHQRVLLDFVAAHRRSVVRIFAGGTKTYTLAYLGLHCLGTDRNGRGAIIGATAGSASKVLSVIRDAIEDSRNEFPEVHAVFPSLAPSPLLSDPWGQNRITVDRPAGIRDPSFIAVGVNSDLPGARLKWIVCDDILDEVNTATRESRDKLKRNFGRKVLTRLDVRDAWIVVANTPWEHDDLTFDLEKAGWPTLSMEIEGEIRFQTDRDWSSGELRPSRTVPGAWRLTAHDSEKYGAPRCELLPDGAVRKVLPGDEPAGPEVRFDADELIPLWPEKFSAEVIARLRDEFRAMPGEFMAKYKLRPRAPLDETRKRRLVEECKLNGLAIGHRALATSYRGPNSTFTGIDVATSVEDGADLRAIFTFEQIPELTFFLPDGRRRVLRNARKILNVQFGLWSMPEFVDRIEREARDFGSLCRVEVNACFAKGTRVLTISGFKPIEEVVVGDLVWTHAGRWRPVIEVLSGSTKLVCTVKARGCLPVRATINHWFYSRAAGRTPGRKGGHHRPIGGPGWVSVGTSRDAPWSAVAVPSWPAIEPKLEIIFRRKCDRWRNASVVVTEEIAFFLGLFMAEGHTTKGHVWLTLSKNEEDVAEYAAKILRSLGASSVEFLRLGSVLRVRAAHAALSRALKFGTYEKKSPPIAWMGWPLPIRIAMVRGWLLGDGCLIVNNKASGRGRSFLSGMSISRSWIFFARATLMQAGFRASLAPVAPRSSRIEGRSIVSKPGYKIALTSDDTIRFLSEATLDVERRRWAHFRGNKRQASGAAIVLDGVHGWALRTAPDASSHEYRYDFTGVEEPVFNLRVEEDESFTAEDFIVHNAQDILRQWLVNRDVSIPLEGHTTGAENKNHRQHGVAGVMIELENLAWIIPCDEQGRCPEAVERWISELLDYRPERHPGDVLIASWLAREEARRVLGDGAIPYDLASVAERFR